MEKTKVSKRLISFVLALTMLFTVCTAAISTSAGPVTRLVNNLVLPKHDAKLKNAANRTLDLALINGTLLFNAIPSKARDFAVADAVLTAKDLADVGADIGIINLDALLGTSALVDEGKEKVLIGVDHLIAGTALNVSLLHKAIAFGIIPDTDVIRPIDFGRNGIFNDLADLVFEDTPLVTLGAANIAVSLLPAHHPLPFVWLPIAHGLIPIHQINHFAFGAITLLNGSILGGVDLFRLAGHTLFAMTPISDAVFFGANALAIGHKVFGVIPDHLKELTGLNSIILGDTLLALNAIQLVNEPLVAKAYADLKSFERKAAALLGTGAAIYAGHVIDNLIWNIPTQAAAAVGTGLALGAAGLAAANAVAGTGLALGTAAVATPAVAAVAAVPALGLGAAGLGAAALAGTTAVVGTGLALGAAALGTAAALGAAALGTAAVGTALVASNLLGKDSDSDKKTETAAPVATNPVASVVEKVTESVPTATTNAATDNVASTDGPIED